MGRTSFGLAPLGLTQVHLPSPLPKGVQTRAG
jgi:hypothetical protein